MKNKYIVQVVNGRGVHKSLSMAGLVREAGSIPKAEYIMYQVKMFGETDYKGNTYKKI